MTKPPKSPKSDSPQQAKPPEPARSEEGFRSIGETARELLEKLMKGL